MNLIRRLLYNLLGKSLYFRIISRSFLVLYKTGILKAFQKFRTHYLVKKLIRKNDVIIDIGANLGYYTTIFAGQTGSGGRVYAVEPVKLYMDILKINTLRYTNIEYIPFALSDSEGESVMSIESDKKYRHGLTKIISDNKSLHGKDAYSVLRKTPESEFGELKKLDYIKCDIEGHEIKVIPGFKKLIEKFNPVIQIELEKTNFDIINNFLTAYAYKAYSYSNKKLVRVSGEINITGDIIYIPEKRYAELNNILNL
jgi:FkbM family methyltransferase